MSDIKMGDGLTLIYVAFCLGIAAAFFLGIAAGFALGVFSFGH